MQCPGGVGLLGDEDTGSLSTWYLFSALGFYPICPGKPVYALGSPLFSEAEIDLGAGRTLMIRAIRNSDVNVYVQKVTLNGERVYLPFITHANLIAGGELTFEMGSEPGLQAYTFED